MAQIQPEVFFSDLLTVQKKENSFYYTAGVQLSQQYLRSESRAMDFTWQNTAFGRRRESAHQFFRRWHLRVILKDRIIHLSLQSKASQGKYVN